MGNKIQKLAAYADDLIFLISHPIVSIPCLLKELREYGELAGYKVNVEKSEALNLTLPVEVVSLLQRDFKWKWVQKAINFLGVQIPRDLGDVFPLNYMTLLSEVKRDLDRWKVGPFSWFGRINIVKMNILPQILYVFQTLPVKIPKRFFASLQSVIGLAGETSEDKSRDSM